MSAPIKIPRFWFYLACACLVCWGAFTVLLFQRYQTGKQAWRYKVLYETTRLKYLKYEQADKQKKMREFLSRTMVPQTTLSLVQDTDQKGWPFKGGGYTVAVVFSAFDCTACMQRELHIWQGFYEQYPQRANVVGIARTSDPNAIWTSVRGFVTFPTYMDDPQNSMLEALSISHTPTVLLVDNRTRKILDVHFGEPQEDQASFRFKEKIIERLIQS